MACSLSNIGKRNLNARFASPSQQNAPLYKERGVIVQKMQSSVYTVRSTIIFFTFAIAAAGFRPLGQVLAQFMIVWQR